MGNGSRSGSMGGQEKTTTTSSLDCDVGLGLKMQQATKFSSSSSSSSSYPCKRQTMVMPQFAPPSFQHQNHHHHHHLAAASDSITNGFLGTGTGGDGGGLLFYNTTTSNQVMPSASEIFNANLGSSAFSAGGGSMKTPFTASQWQELERQTMIYKYLMASNNVPPELLLPFTKNKSHVSLSQSNTSGLDLKFSSGSDPEPWRCRRTDGKKWRCSRDVAPDQKYCERHAHKSRPRSRKHVEIQPHNSSAAAATTTTTNYSKNHHHPLYLPGDATSQLLQTPTSHSTTIGSATTYDQSRNIMWFMRSGSDNTIPVSTCNQQRQQQQQQQQLMQSSRMGLTRDDTDYNKNISFFQQQYEEDKQEAINLNPYMYGGGGGSNGPRLENYQLNGQYCNSFLDPKMPPLQGGLNDDDDSTIQTTRHFIDAWSTTSERGGIDEIRNNKPACIASSCRKLPLSSLTLSMSGGVNGIDEDNDLVAEMGIGMMNNDEAALRSQWMMNPVSWMNSTTPGGPLGEALCLGNAGITKGASSNLPSPHGGYSNSSATSSCSKGSCEDGSLQFNFIG